MNVQQNVSSHHFSLNDIERSKLYMKEMPFFQAFSPDGFHQTLYGKLNRGSPKTCLIFDHESLIGDLPRIVQHVKDMNHNISIIVTNDIYFKDNCDFLKQENIDNLIMMIPNSRDAIIVGQPSKVSIKVDVISDTLYKHMDKFMSYIASFKIDSRYFEMDPTYVELVNVHSATKNISIEFDMYVNIRTSVEKALQEFDLHIVQYLRQHGLTYTMQSEVMRDGFYNDNIRQRYYLLRLFEKELQQFVTCSANDVCIRSRFLISPNLIGIAYSRENLENALSVGKI